MSSETENLDLCLSYALQRLGSPEMELKREQRSAIESVYRGKDVFVWLPTGFGKSICYQTLPFVFDRKLDRVSSRQSGKSVASSVVLVISPLIALMLDQVMALGKRGVDAAIITTRGEVQEELRATESNMGKYSLLYCTPEALTCSRWREALEKPSLSHRLVAVVVDEAHCVSKWSSDFRPAYGRIHEIRALIPQGVPYLACTATVTRSVREEVVRSLDMNDCDFVCASPDRPNIFYEVCRRTDIETDMHPFVTSLKEHHVNAPRVIIYCQTLNLCADLYAHFHFELGDSSYYPPGVAQVSDNRLFGMFHSNTTQYNKDIILKSLTIRDGVVRIVFVTVALGMGVNLVDCNTVIHYGAPHSIDDYFQESGRVGRSGHRAQSTVFWKPRDCPLKANPSTVRDKEMVAVRQYLDNTSECRRKWLLNYFDQTCAKHGENPSICCDICRLGTKL